MFREFAINFLLKLSNFAGSKVNFIVACKLLKTFFEILKSEESHRIKPLSIYLLNILPSIRNYHEKNRKN